MSAPVVVVCAAVPWLSMTSVALESEQAMAGDRSPLSLMHCKAAPCAISSALVLEHSCPAQAAARLKPDTGGGARASIRVRYQPWDQSAAARALAVLAAALCTVRMSLSSAASSCGSRDVTFARVSALSFPSIGRGPRGRPGEFLRQSHTATPSGAGMEKAGLN